jgi:ankyrin repeat protein
MFLNEKLVRAARDGDAPRVQKMLAYGADVHAWDDVALRWSAGNGHTVIVSMLLARGADVHAKNDEALRMAESNGHVETAKLIRFAIETPPPDGPRPPAMAIHPSLRR